MKTGKITINKTAERPDGVEIEIVQPESPLEEGLLIYLLGGFLRAARLDKRIPYDLPEQFIVAHKGNGTFVASAFGTDAALYEPPRPLMILAIRAVNGRFDLVHAAPMFVQPQVPAVKAEG